MDEQNAPVRELSKDLVESLWVRTCNAMNHTWSDSDRRGYFSAAVIEADRALQREASVMRFMDGVEIERLASALSWAGCGQPESREALAFRLPEFVNHLTRAIVSIKGKLDTPRPAVGNVGMLAVAYGRLYPDGDIGLSHTGSTCHQPLVWKSDAKAALAAKDAEIAEMWTKDQVQRMTAAAIDACEITHVQEIAALRKDADMFWDHDDAERCHGSIDEILNDTWNNGSLEVGAEFTVQKAIRLPNIKVRVTAIDEESGDVAYEQIDAAMTKEPK